MIERTPENLLHMFVGMSKRQGHVEHQLGPQIRRRDAYGTAPQFEQINLCIEMLGVENKVWALHQEVDVGIGM